MSIERVVTESGKFMYDRFHFAEGSKSHGHIFCSGVIGQDAKGKLPEDVTEEFRNAWRKIDALLAEAGSDLAHIVELTSYHVGLQTHMADFMAVRDEFLQEPWPAWTAIGITELAAPGAHVEIKVVARLLD